MSEAESAAEQVAVEEVVEQTVEIEEVVDEALELLDQIRYSLKTLEDRLSHLRRARKDIESGPPRVRRPLRPGSLKGQQQPLIEGPTPRWNRSRAEFDEQTHPPERDPINDPINDPATGEDEPPNEDDIEPGVPPAFDPAIKPPASPP